MGFDFTTQTLNSILMRYLQIVVKVIIFIYCALALCIEFLLACLAFFYLLVNIPLPFFPYTSTPIPEVPVKTIYLFDRFIRNKTFLRHKIVANRALLICICGFTLYYCIRI